MHCKCQFKMYNNINIYLIQARNVFGIYILILCMNQNHTLQEKLIFLLEPCAKCSGCTKKDFYFHVLCSNNAVPYQINWNAKILSKSIFRSCAYTCLSFSSLTDFVSVYDVFTLFLIFGKSVVNLLQIFCKCFAKKWISFYNVFTFLWKILEFS